MKKLWEKSEILFAVLFIAIYVIGNSLLDQASTGIGIRMILTLPFDVLLIALLLAFIKRNGLNGYYGLCAPKTAARRMLFYIPLLLIATVNVWFGVVCNQPLIPGRVYFLAMIATGIVEELLFRGLLFRAMSRKSLRSAIVLTSLLFGLGHIVNLFNGSGMELLENLCQLAYAVSIGFLLAAVLVRGQSLLPCIATHAVFNALSLFANNPMQERYQIPVTVSLCVLSAAAGVYYLRSGQKEEAK